MLKLGVVVSFRVVFRRWPLSEGLLSIVYYSRDAWGDHFMNGSSLHEGVISRGEGAG